MIVKALSSVDDMVILQHRGRPVHVFMRDLVIDKLDVVGYYLSPTGIVTKITRGTVIFDLAVRALESEGLLELYGGVVDSETVKVAESTQLPTCIGCPFHTGTSGSGHKFNAMCSHPDNQVSRYRVRGRATVSKLLSPHKYPSPPLWCKRQS